MHIKKGILVYNIIYTFIYTYKRKIIASEQPQSIKKKQIFEKKINDFSVIICNSQITKFKQQQLLINRALYCKLFNKRYI